MLDEPVFPMPAWKTTVPTARCALQARAPPTEARRPMALRRASRPWASGGRGRCFSGGQTSTGVRGLKLSDLIVQAGNHTVGAKTLRLDVVL